MSEYLYFNTRDRNEGENNADCIFYTNSLRGKRNSYISLVDFNLPITFYPISAQRQNHQIYLQEDGSTTTLTGTLATDTNYSGSTLASEVEDALNASGTAKTYAVAYDTPKGRLIITVSAGTFRFVNGINSAHIELGYDVAIPTYYATGKTLDYPVDVSGTKYIDIITNLGSTQSWNSTGTYQVTARVTSGASFGEVLQHSFMFPQDIRAHEGTDRFNFQLRDDKGKIIALGPNTHASYTFILRPAESDRDLVEKNLK